MLQTTLAAFLAATSFVSTNISPAPLHVEAQTLTIQQKIELASNSKGLDPKRVVAIADAESDFAPEAVNPNGDDSGVFQFQDDTFQEQCIDKYKVASSLDEKNNIDVQIACATNLMKDGQWWRWASSRDVWDPQYPGCNCVASARLADPSIPLIDASQFVPNATIPRVGDLIVMKYGKLYHVALIGSITEAGIMTKSEGNYFKCIVKDRLVKFDDIHILGYWHNPQKD